MGVVIGSESAGPPHGGPAFTFRFLYGTSTPSTKSWIAPAARPVESTVSLPVRVLILNWLFATSEWRIPTKGATPSPSLPSRPR